MSLLRILFLILTLSSSLITAQDNQNTFVVVQANETVSIPADIIIFSINLEAESSDPQKAFDLHKEQEKNLVQLLGNFGIADSNISFSLLNISSNRIYEQEQRPSFRTYQTINVRLYDFNQYVEFQIALLSNPDPIGTALAEDLILMTN